MKLTNGGSVPCGHPADGMTVRIVDPVTRAVCAEGESGEIQVAGPSVAHGYWNRPLESSRVFVVDDGRCWLTTGDLGSLHDGELHVTGRIKDLLIVRGSKHFPQDLERTAERRHPGVRIGGVAQYVVDRFGKFPATVPAIFILTYLQAHHLDLEFYDRFFQ